MKLSIIIPSYNRPERLTKSLYRLVDQCTDHSVSIKILDNHSPVAIESIISEKFGNYRDIIEVTRNRVNIGGDANICRCYEFADSEWFWLLGDDDEPSQDAVSIILNEIEKASLDCGYICFATNKGRFERKHVLKKHGDFWAFVTKNTALNNMSFISSGVYRSSAAKNCLLDAYRAIHTRFCQLVIVREIHRRGNSIQLSDQSICEWLFPEAGHELCSIGLLSGIADLLNVDGFGVDSKRSLQMLFHSCYPKPFFKWVWKQSNQRRDKEADYMMRLFVRVIPISKGRQKAACIMGIGICWLRSWMPPQHSSSNI